MRIDRSRFEQLENEVGRAWKLSEDGNPGEGLQVVCAVCNELAQAGRTSGFTLWHVALIATRMGELEMAFDYITQALESDPIAAPLRRSFVSITHQMREALAAGTREATDPSTPRLYDLLVRSGEADVGCHLAMVRWCSAAGDHARARALADAVTALHPLDREAWLCAAEAARSAGDGDSAARATAEAAALCDEPVPFALQEVARG